MLRRYAAWSLDALLLSGPALLLSAGKIAEGLARIKVEFERVVTTMMQTMMVQIESGGAINQLHGVLMQDAGLQSAIGGLTASIMAALWPPLLAFALLSWVYFTLFEASAWQATPGKRLLGLRVVSAVDGSRLGVGRAALRQLAGVLSWLTLNLGHVWAGRKPQRRALHDHVAGARVVQSMDPGTPLPFWAKLWLLLQDIALIAGVFWLFSAAHEATLRIFDSMLL